MAGRGWWGAPDRGRRIGTLQLLASMYEVAAGADAVKAPQCHREEATPPLLGDASEVAGDEHLDLELGARCLIQRAADRAVRRGQSLREEPIAMLGRIPDRDGP